MPRFYLEIALLKSYRFSFETSGYTSLLERLTNMAKGFGEPISAVYARYEQIPQINILLMIYSLITECI